MSLREGWPTGLDRCTEHQSEAEPTVCIDDRVGRVTGGRRGICPGRRPNPPRSVAKRHRCDPVLTGARVSWRVLRVSWREESPSGEGL